MGPGETIESLSIQLSVKGSQVQFLSARHIDPVQRRFRRSGGTFFRLPAAGVSLLGTHTIERKKA